jgi:phosphomannomutase
MFMATKFRSFQCDGAIMITASHLPYERNGFKYFDAEGGLQKADIAKIIEYAEDVLPKESEDKAAARRAQDEAAMLDAVRAMKEKLEKTPVPDAYKDDSKGLSAAKEDAKRDAKTDGSITARSQIVRDRPIFAQAELGAYIPDLMETYAAHLRSLIIEGVQKGLADGAPAFDPEYPLAGLTVAVDAGNGAGGFYATEVLEPLGANVAASRYLDPNGAFPNHAPNPEDKAAVDALREAVLGGSCDLGIIFDTDVDRSAAVTGAGREVARNGIVALAALLVAKEHPGSTIVTDSITSIELGQFLEDTLGLKHLRYMRGYKNVINKALELTAQGIDCPLAIETSGHAALKENYYLDDGAYLATKIIIKAALLKQEGSNLDDLLAALKEPAEAREVRMPITAEDFGGYADQILDDLKAWVSGDNSAESRNMPSAFGQTLSMQLVSPNYEGVRINFYDAAAGGDAPMGWCLLRRSLHDPLMPLNIESGKEGGAEEIAAMLRPFFFPYSALDSSKL